MNDNSLYQDPSFRRIVVYGTGVGLASMVASLASIEISPSGVGFRWHWSLLLWMAATFAFNARIWKLVWHAQVDSSPRLKRKLALHCGVLLAVGLGSFLYPVRFIAEGHHSGVIRGLLTAALFLGTLAWLIRQLASGFVSQDATELQRQRKAHGAEVAG